VRIASVLVGLSCASTLAMALRMSWGYCIAPRRCGWPAPHASESAQRGGCTCNASESRRARYLNAILAGVLPNHSSAKVVGGARGYRLEDADHHLAEVV